MMGLQWQPKVVKCASQQSPCTSLPLLPVCVHQVARASVCAPKQQSGNPWFGCELLGWVSPSVWLGRDHEFIHIACLGSNRQQILGNHLCIKPIKYFSRWSIKNFRCNGIANDSRVARGKMGDICSIAP